MAITQVNIGSLPDGVGGDTPRSAMVKINTNFTDNANAASRLVGTATGNVMEVGAFGIGKTPSISSPPKSFGFYNGIGAGYILPSGVVEDNTIQYGTAICVVRNDIANTLFFGSGGISLLSINTATDAVVKQAKVYTTQNTTKDSNGFLKSASPIVQLFADKIELNNEAAQQEITFEKLGVGDYLVKGSLGFAQEGWYIEMPKDANGNVLVAVIYEQLENNDISVKTYAKKFDEETGDILPNLDKPRDIPETRWIDLRLESISK